MASPAHGVTEGKEVSDTKSLPPVNIPSSLRYGFSILSLTFMTSK